eukprot:NODE_7423_length_569_cov_3.503846_g6411_i0.p2 GENE.NODE_7423_length_569_cov_3.503846_g6411_i0~~NODE_7423_length_569_cov_3.503846_g6411_i0.p2  ORF type:complete len:170 (+),score=2.81 NODE_7423_length_569_cov_3.503846_g6411_i0:73-510(+)
MPVVLSSPIHTHHSPSSQKVPWFPVAVPLRTRWRRPSRAGPLSLLPRACLLGQIPLLGACLLKASPVITPIRRPTSTHLSLHHPAALLLGFSAVSLLCSVMLSLDPRSSWELGPSIQVQPKATATGTHLFRKDVVAVKRVFAPAL